MCAIVRMYKSPAKTISRQLHVDRSIRRLAADSNGIRRLNILIRDYLLQLCSYQYFDVIATIESSKLKLNKQIREILKFAQELCELYINFTAYIKLNYTFAFVRILTFFLLLKIKMIFEMMYINLRRQIV